jgi:Protein of unknown function (DUF1571)
MTSVFRRGSLLLTLLCLLSITTLDAQSANPNTTIEPARAAKLRELIGNANQSLERLGDYRVRMRRREIVANKTCHEDLVMLTIRSKPFAVHVKCLTGSENEGRQIIYHAGRPEEMFQVLTGKGDVLAGMRMDVSINSLVVTSSCRRGLNEAGFANMIQRFGLAVDKYLSGQGRVSEFEPIGLQTRAESRAPMEVVIQRILPGEEPLLQHGGIRYWHFNADADAAERHLPTLVITFDDKGQEVEYYLHDRLIPKVTLDAHDFNADKIWK